MWQDYAFATCALLFGYALIPQMVKIYKKKSANQLSWQLLVCQFLAISLATITCKTLDLNLSSFINGLQLICLSIIIGQKIYYARML